MNTTKTVFNKLYSKKTELETHKVELSVVGDIKKQNEILKKQLSRFRKIQEGIAKDRTRILEADNKAKKNIPNYEKVIDSNSKLVSNAIKVLSEAEKAAKELGLNYKDISGYGELEQYIKFAKNDEDFESKSLANLKSLI